MLFLLFYPHLLSAYHVPKPLLSNYIHYLIYSSQLWMIIILLLLQMRKWILICTLGNLCRITKLIYGRVGTQTSKDMFAATLRYYRISLPKSYQFFGGFQDVLNVCREPFNCPRHPPVSSSLWSWLCQEPDALMLLTLL